MSFLESYADAYNQDFQKRVTSGIYKAAQNVASEAKGLMTDAQYTKRQNLAFRTKNQGESFVAQWSLSICSGGLITTASTDQDIEFTINSQWDAFAGVTDLDKVP
jgi:hypothetical protein